ncbi:MAG TPA: glycosyltransferase family 39 protein [Planctomycetota bacterium]|nr:glycosyltransferase family 39 protein [Planctomycetota bacterium]
MLALRLHHVGRGLPWLTEPDAHISAVVQHLAGGGAATEESEFLSIYPHLVARLAQPFAGRREPAPGEAWGLEQHLEEASRPYLAVRRVVAVLSVLMVPATWLLARLVLAPGWALFAAALAATSLLDLCFAQQARPHAAAAGLALLAVVAAVRLRRRGDGPSYLLAGIAAGLALGTLQNTAAALFALLAAHLLRERPRRRVLEPRALFALLPILAALAAFQPYLFTGLVKLAGGRFQVAGQSIAFSDFRGGGFATILGTLASYEPVVLALAVLGALLGLSRLSVPHPADPRISWRDLAVLAAYVVPYTLVIGLYDKTWERFVLPLVPYLACLGAWGTCHLARRATRGLGRPARAAVSTALALAALALPAWASLRLASLRREPDPLELTARWLREHVRSEDERLRIHPVIDLPLARAEPCLVRDGELRPEIFKPWEVYQALLPPGASLGTRYWIEKMLLPPSSHPAIERDPRDYLDSLAADYFIVYTPTTPLGPPASDLVHATLRREGVLLARFPPWSGPGAPPLARFQDSPGAGSFTWLALRAVALGPPIEVFALSQREE